MLDITISLRCFNIVVSSVIHHFKVHLIHEWAWPGTPNENAAWLRLQRLEDTWHRVLLISVTGGLAVGMMHGLLEILNQIRQNLTSQRLGFDLVA
ncbi:CHLORIDE CHANNEL PROTEIN CLC-F [Salix purpurea]|uniref:CHLORIDE CHANNEL PROTEIN CLC-F n=1 Tax=Salix purpurea TaxID=77065 RepID=A0A9Q0WP90_SALPP|nr:CHLORIDE CHANNEL PROTEIN CLC-F [Salix purpurea]